MAHETRTVTPWTRERWVELASGEAEAIEFESQTLAIGREFLPEYAIAVLEGREPTQEYWAWLAHELACVLMGTEEESP